MRLKGIEDFNLEQWLLPLIYIYIVDCSCALDS